ncbi:unnamed protein product [Rotaria socialis]|uniref:Ammonium transporter AmtB-like domain-containing protein n=1 Tax=Rotaria socialis TaxID=392032 RepID=A0A817VLI6_9BILA|nr:unnamed protein product [Rotaria socialis]CAF4332299.1 unnamed protein product [Rotaria socialis]
MLRFRKYLLATLLLIIQISFCFLFGFHARYVYAPVSSVKNLTFSAVSIVEYYYPMFMDIHVMMFVGFGFLMTFLYRYSYSAIAFNFVLCAFTFEWALLMRGYFFNWDTNGQQFAIDIKSLITSDYVAASILISMGAVLGKVNPFQLILMAFCEVPVQVVNEWIGRTFFCANDAGESIFVHLFGAYFGLAVMFVLFRSDMLDSPHQKSRYTSDIFSMIGTIFLFCFWPSFNAANTAGPERLRAVINTCVSICSSVLGTFIASSLVRRGKLDIVHVQSATLAGGVAVGTVAASNIGLHGALIIGTLAGFVSTLGFYSVLPKLEVIRIHDTCGVHNLHGIPGLMSGIAGIIVASIPEKSGFQDHLTVLCLTGGLQRSSNIQVAYQAAAVGLTLIVAIAGGLFTGVLLRLPLFSQESQYFDDKVHWHIPKPEHTISLKM